MFQVVVGILFLIFAFTTNAIASYTTRCIDLGGGYVNCTTDETGMKVYRRKSNNNVSDPINGFFEGYARGQQIRAQEQQIAIMQQQALLIAEQKRQLQAMNARNDGYENLEYILSGQYMDDQEN